VTEYEDTGIRIYRSQLWDEVWVPVVPDVDHTQQLFAGRLRDVKQYCIDTYSTGIVRWRRIDRDTYAMEETSE